MNLNDVATQAATDVSNVVSLKLTETDLQKVTTIIAKSMSMAVLEASSQHTSVCVNCLSHEKDLAHKIREEMELKKIALMANLSGLR